jgi:hypothetical protein
MLLLVNWSAEKPSRVSSAQFSSAEHRQAIRGTRSIASRRGSRPSTGSNQRPAWRPAVRS